MDRATVTRRVWELSEPVASAAGLELVDVQYRPEGGRLILRLLIDRPEGGVTLDELARVSRELGDVLDTHEPHAGRRQFHGVLEAVADDAITVHDPDAGVVSFALDSIERASIQFDFPRPARPP